MVFKSSKQRKFVMRHIRQGTILAENINYKDIGKSEKYFNKVLKMPVHAIPSLGGSGVFNLVASHPFTKRIALIKPKKMR